MNKYFRVIIFLIFVTFLLSCAKEQKEGLLWKISGNGLDAPSYLFGTGHGDGFYMGCSMLDSVPGFYESLRNTDQYVGERNDRETGIPYEIKLPSDSTYDKLLSRDDLALLDSVLLKAVGRTSKNYPIVPEMLSMLIRSHLYYEHTRKSVNPDESRAITSVSMDNCLQRLARGRGYKIVGLDNLIEFNFTALLREGSLKAATDSLILALRNKSFEKGIEKSKTDSLSAQLLDAYCKQDLKELERVFEAKGQRYDKEYEERLKKYPESKHLLNEISSVRNHKWMLHIPRLIKEKTSFIAVGVGHLPGEEGLISLLREKGYTVEPVN